MGVGTTQGDVMDDKEGFDAQQEAKREVLGPTDRSTRLRIWDGLTKYLAAEARHARKAAAGDKTPPTEEGQDRRGS
jgi:hypothetical protein